MKRIVQIVLAVFFGIAGLLHFLWDDSFAQIVSPMLPFPVMIVWVTGAMEIAIAAALFLKWRLRLTGKLLSVYLLAVLPANIYMAIARIPLGGSEMSQEALWFRVFLQFPLIALVLWATHGKQSTARA